VKEGLEMVITNKTMRRVEGEFLVETVKLASFMENYWGLVVPLPAPEVKVPVVVRGSAEEAGGHLFNLYLLDKEGFER